jgi:hypothetical protein
MEADVRQMDAFPLTSTARTLAWKFQPGGISPIESDNTPDSITLGADHPVAGLILGCEEGAPRRNFGAYSRMSSREVFPPTVPFTE